MVLSYINRPSKCLVFEWFRFLNGGILGSALFYKNLQTDLVLTIQNLDEFGFQMPTEYLNSLGNWKVPVFESHWKFDFYSPNHSKNRTFLSASWDYFWRYIGFYHSKTDLQKSGFRMIHPKIQIHPKTRLLLVWFLQWSFADIMSDFQIMTWILDQKRIKTRQNVPILDTISNWAGPLDQIQKAE